MKQSIILSLTCTTILGAALAAPPGHISNDTRQERNAARYTVRAIPVPSGFSYAGAVAINTFGEAVGSASGTQGSQPMLNAASGYVMLETLGGTYHNGHDINAAGQIAGSSQSEPWWGSKAVRWEADGSMTVIMPLTGNENDNSYGMGINSLGQIVGLSDTNDGMWHAFLWDDAQGMIDLGTLGGSYSSANDVNHDGVVVGRSRTQGGADAAFVWQDGVMSALPNLANSEIPGGEATAINNHGTIVGQSNGVQYGIQLAVLWDGNGNIRPLGSLGGLSSWANDINDRGVIVGEALVDSGNRRAFIYENGEMRDLNELLPANSGWVLERAIGISEDGRIVGEGRLNGEFRSFVMEPARAKSRSK